MRVCVLTPFLDVYKGGNHLSLFGACADVQFTVVTSRVIPKDVPLPSNVRVEPIPGNIGPFWYGIADVQFARNVLRKYSPHHAFWTKFDVLHLNQTLSPSLLQLERAGVPLLYATHHPVSVDRVTALAESPCIERLRWWARYALPLRFQHRCCRRASSIMTVSEAVKRRLIDDYGCASERIRVIPNGVDGNVFCMSDEADYDVCAVGSLLHPRKGFRYLLEAYRKLSAFSFQLSDVGRRSTEQIAALKQIPNVTIHGTVPHDKLVEIIRRSKVLISTSLYEGFGLSLIEALACGRPAVAFDSGAVREVLRPIDEHLVVPQRDVSALVERVRMYLRVAPEERRELRRKTLELYALEKSAVALRGLYASLRFPHEGGTDRP